MAVPHQTQQDFLEGHVAGVTSGGGVFRVPRRESLTAAGQGHVVRFAAAAQSVIELIEARGARELTRLAGCYGRVGVLILDELGARPLSRADVGLLFRVLCGRRERRPVFVSTNLPFNEWALAFPNTRLCRAVVDRLTHRAHIIETGTHTIRLTDSLARAGKGCRSQRAPPAALPPRLLLNRQRGERNRYLLCQKKSRPFLLGWSRIRSSQWGQCKLTNRGGD